MSETGAKSVVGESSRDPIVEVVVGETVLSLLGTAHVSRRSVERVTELLHASPHYDAVAVELCQSRYQALTDPSALATLDLFAVIREKRAYMVAANLALSAYQQRLAAEIGVAPGAEQRAAIIGASEQDLPLWLIDREIGITLKRAARNLGFFQRLNLFAGLAAALLSRDRVTEADIEALKQGDVLETAFGEFAENRQGLFDPLIRERDRYMAARLREELARNPVKRALVVIGAGHCEGLSKQLREQFETPAEILTDLQSVPPTSQIWRIMPWVIVAVILALFALGFSRGGLVGWAFVGDWILINGGLSALGAMLAGGHLLTVFGAFCAAPLTSLNPTVGAGMVTAAIELFVRRPQVADFARLRDDVMRWPGWWRNRVARVFLVFVFSTLGSALGTYLAGFHLVARLFG